jgi:periplasmic protein TonB
MAFPGPDPRPVDPDDRGLDPYYRFLTSSPPAAARSRHGVGRLASALAAHLAFFLVVTFVVRRAPAVTPQQSEPKKSITLVWKPSPGGGGPKGSGGEDAPEPAQQATLVGHDAITVPVAAPPRLDPSTIVDPPPPRLDIPAMPVASGLQEAVGVIAEVRPVDLDTRGPGSGDGAGGPRGRGIGDGEGDRIGDGNRGPGDGDGFPPGNGVSWPRLVQEVKPNYTADAMRARLQGIVELEIVVLPDGTVGRVQLRRSLDATFGLDDEAIKAVRLWRFDPGRRLGKAIATRVGVELSFRLR